MLKLVWAVKIRERKKSTMKKNLRTHISEGDNIKVNAGNNRQIKCMNSITGILIHHRGRSDNLIPLAQTEWLKEDSNSRPMAFRVNALAN